jgi:hypothetical protein
MKLLQPTHKLAYDSSIAYNYLIEVANKISFKKCPEVTDIAFFHAKTDTYNS